MASQARLHDLWLPTGFVRSQFVFLLGHCYAERTDLPVHPGGDCQILGLERFDVGNYDDKSQLDHVIRHCDLSRRRHGREVARVIRRWYHQGILPQRECFLCKCPGRPHIPGHRREQPAWPDSLRSQRQAARANREQLIRSNRLQPLLRGPRQ